jgi:hypothetical protein
MSVRPGARSVRFRLGIIVTFLSAAGCAPAPDRALHTVEDYKADATLRREMLARCANDPGSFQRSADCVNVRVAQKSVDVGSLRTLPPLRLPDSKTR